MSDPHPLSGETTGSPKTAPNPPDAESPLKGDRSRVIRHESHPLWDVSRMIRAFSRTVRHESHLPWDVSRMIRAFARTVRHESHSQWDVSRMIPSFARTLRHESHFKWDSCRIIRHTSHPSGDSCRMARDESHLSGDFSRIVPSRQKSSQVPPFPVRAPAPNLPHPVPTTRKHETQAKEPAPEGNCG